MLNDIYGDRLPSEMSASDHIAEAERLLEMKGMGTSATAVQRAQAHATLAIAKQLRASGGQTV